MAMNAGKAGLYNRSKALREARQEARENVVAYKSGKTLNFVKANIFAGVGVVLNGVEVEIDENSDLGDEAEALDVDIEKGVDIDEDE